jgi:hypothetical protein
MNNINETKDNISTENKPRPVLIFISTPLAVAHLGEARTVGTGQYSHWTMLDGNFTR